MRPWLRPWPPSRPCWLGSPGPLMTSAAAAPPCHRHSPALCNVGSLFGRCKWRGCKDKRRAAPPAVCRLQDVPPALPAPQRRHQVRSAADGAGRAVTAVPPAPAGVPRHGRRVRRGRAGAGLRRLRRLPPAALACRGRVCLLLAPPGHAAAAGLGGRGPLPRRAGAVRGPLPEARTGRGCLRLQAQPARAWRCSGHAELSSALRGGAAKARHAPELAEACWCHVSHPQRLHIRLPNSSVLPG